MKRITFVCLGNICRSPAAEYIFKHIIKQLNKENEYEVISRATSYEEVGNDIYPPMKRTLNNLGVSLNTHHATRFSKEDYENSDYIFYMEETNLHNLKRIQDDKDNKYYPIYQWSDGIYGIEDPWYSGKYEKVCEQITKCIRDILSHI